MTLQSDSMETAKSPARILATAWSLSLIAVAASRFRGEWDAYQAVHQWCAQQGVPNWVRNLDSLVLCSIIAFSGAGLVAWWCGGSAAARLQLRLGRPGWWLMVLIAIFPMVAGGAVLCVLRWTSQATFDHALSRFVSGVIRAPIAEELLFRGLLVGVCAAAVGWSGRRFWLNSVAAALLFAITHIVWTIEGFTNGWATLLVTGAGGLWYAWLLARWRSLWVPMILHAGMNLGWLLAGASGGAGGGGWMENVLRVATITIATWWTVRKTTTAHDPATTP